MISNSTIIFTIAGFASGSVMYSYLIPRLLRGSDVRAAAADKNPGAANAGLVCGKGVGILCGVLDVLKAFVPVFIACMMGATQGWALVPIMVAPVLGHAFSPMLHFRGGKAISAAYGALLGLLWWHPLGLVLAGAMLVTVIVIKNHATAVSVSSLLFMIVASFMFPADAPVKLTAYLLGGILIYKHLPEAYAHLFRHEDGRVKVN